MNASAWQLNPILVREVRARWRKWPAFAIMFGYAVVLAVTIGWRCYDLASWPGSGGVKDPTKLGREMFVTLTWLQTIGWMLLAPVLAAPALAGERERGLLDAVQLSALSPDQIVRGKMLSLLSFIFLMLLVPLPIMALCFLLGGVSPGEFIGSFFLHASTAFFCASVGLAASARRLTTSTALSKAICAMIGWHFCLFVVGGIFGIPFSPFLATDALLGTSDGFAPFWMSGIFAQFALGGYLLVCSGPALRQKIEPPLPAFATVYDHPFSSTAPPVPVPAISVKASDYEWVAMPFADRLHLPNPAAQREAMRRLRVRRDVAGLHESSVGCVMVLGPVTGFYVLFMVLCAPQARAETWRTLAFVWMLAIIIFLPLWAAGALTHEREAGLLESLLLSRLTPREIVQGKLVGLLSAGLYFSLPLLLIMLPCLWPHHAGTGDNISPAEATATMLLVGATAFAGCGLGLWFSSRCRSTMTALAGTIATLLFVLAFLPMLFASNAFTQFHPFGALSRAVLDGHYHTWPTVMSAALPCITMLMAGGLLLLRATRTALERAARERDKNVGRRNALMKQTHGPQGTTI